MSLPLLESQKAGLFQALTVGFFFNVLHGFEQLLFPLSKGSPQSPQGLGFTLLGPQHVPHRIQLGAERIGERAARHSRAFLAAHVQVAFAEAAVQVDGQRFQPTHVRHRGGDLLLQLLHSAAVPAPAALHGLPQALQNRHGRAVHLPEVPELFEALQLQLDDVPGFEVGLDAAVHSATEELRITGIAGLTETLRLMI